MLAPPLWLIDHARGLHDDHIGFIAAGESISKALDDAIHGPDQGRAIEASYTVLALATNDALWTPLLHAWKGMQG